MYELNWDDRGEYIRDPTRFEGFFAGEGNRTYIPNQFFDHVVRSETLAVIKVVGSVIRFSIGFQNKWGHRRQQIALSYLHIQRYAHLRDRKTLAAAIRHGLASHYLQRVEAGYFDPNGGRQSRTAVYALRWLDSAADGDIGRKSPPAKSERENQSENPTGIGRKLLPDERSVNPTGSEITSSNNTSKQTDVAAFEALKKIGFEPKVARAMATAYPLERIQRQIEWLPRRTVKSNKLGLLRAALEGDWPLPSAGELGRPNRERPERSTGETFEDAIRRTRSRFNQ